MKVHRIERESKQFEFFFKLLLILKLILNQFMSKFDISHLLLPAVID